MSKMADPLDAASGYFDLGHFVDAWSALDDLAPEQKTCLAVVWLNSMQRDRTLAELPLIC